MYIRLKVFVFYELNKNRIWLESIFLNLNFLVETSFAFRCPPKNNSQVSNGRIVFVNETDIKIRFDD